MPLMTYAGSIMPSGSTAMPAPTGSPDAAPMIICAAVPEQM